MSSDSPTPAEPAHQPPSALEAARLELEASRRQIAELEDLLQDLPGIFERKFDERIEPLLERQRRLLDENHALRDRLSRLLPQAGTTGSPAAAGAGTAPTATEAPVAASSADAADAAAPPPVPETQPEPVAPPGEPSLPALPQLRRNRAGTSRLSGQGGRVA